ncbi:MAG: extracellular solute-binding protein [Caldilineaceae bacterium SB0666_bin_21]|nr:extracellular solute-binding protein [Caldilineaceae bacterium SB0666_bin_21]
MSRVFVKRLTLPAILVLILLAATVSCSVANPESQPTDVEDAGPEQVTVVYWGHNFTPRVELDEKYIAEFMELNPHITVEYEAIPTDFDQKLRTALAAGTGPDLFAQWNGDIGTFYAQGAIAPVAFEAIGYDSQQAFMDLYVAPENTLQGAMFDGKLYGIPNELSIYGCYVNNRLFEEAGLDPDTDFPATWEEMLVVAEKLTKRDDEGRLVQRGFDFSWSNSVWMFLEYGAMVRQLGGSELNLLTPEAEKAMQYWVDWEANGLGGPAYFEGQMSGFIAEELAIECDMGSWARPGVLEAGIDYTVKSVPIWENAVNQNHFDIYAYFHMVNSRSEPAVQEAAWQLAEYLDSHPADYLAHTGLLQARVEVVESETFQNIPFLDVFLDQMTTSMYSPRIARFTEVADVLARVRDRIIVEGMDLKESMAIGQEEIDSILSETR